MDEEVTIDQLRIGDVFYHEGSNNLTYIVTGIDNFGKRAKHFFYIESDYSLVVGTTSIKRTKPKTMPDWCKKYTKFKITRKVVTVGLP